MSLQSATAWAPATIANLNVGFDGLGCALETPGETIIATWDPSGEGLTIAEITGASGLSMNPLQNVAGVAALSLMKALGVRGGVSLKIDKQILPGSGIGSSAASAAAAVVAIDGLFHGGLRPDELLTFALDGEALASGSRHADNVAPALMGGLVLCPPEGRPRALKVPEDWAITVVHPQVVVKTSEARGVLPKMVPFQDAIQQARWFATFVSACADGDAETAGFALEDLLVTPHRSALIPGFEELRKLAFDHGARAGGISGSGPSTFWIGKGEDWKSAHWAAEFYEQRGITAHVYPTTISAKGAHIIA